MIENSYTLSACLVVYNEEQLIERCLKSISGLATEIIIIHDGECTDKTLEIAKKYTDNIFIQPHAGMCEVHRVYSLEKATSEWVLIIDADEFFSESTISVLKRKLIEPTADAFSFTWPIWNGEHYITESWPRKTVLFRKNKVSYLGFPHEPMQCSGQIELLSFPLEHQPKYNNQSLKVFRTKQLKWAKVHAALLMQPFENIPKFNYHRTNWPKELLFMKRNPILFPLYGVAFFLFTLKSGAYRSGLFGFRESVKSGLYYAAVFYFVWKSKN